MSRGPSPRFCPPWMPCEAISIGQAAAARRIDVCDRAMRAGYGGVEWVVRWCGGGRTPAWRPQFGRLNARFPERRFLVFFPLRTAMTVG